MTDDQFMKDDPMIRYSIEMTILLVEEVQRENRPGVPRLSLQEDPSYPEAEALELVVMGGIVTSETTLSQEEEAVAMTGTPESGTTPVPEGPRRHSEPTLDHHSGSRETRILSREEGIQERPLHPCRTFQLGVEASGAEVEANGITAEQEAFTPTIDPETLEVILEIASGTLILGNTAWTVQGARATSIQNGSENASARTDPRRN